MKKYFLISSIILLFFSCKKDTQTLRAGNYFYYTNATPAISQVIQGVKTTCDVVKFTGGDKKSLSISMYLDNGYWIQTGYHTYNKSTIPFVQIWKNGQQAGADVVFLANPPLAFGQKQSFSIYNVAGSTKWRTTRGGIDCLEIELFTSNGYGAELYTETGPVSTPGRFPVINFYPAIETFVNGTWQSPSAGICSAASWGIEGQLQNPSLRTNELNIGSGLNATPSGSLLWNSNN